MEFSTKEFSKLNLLGNSVHRIRMRLLVSMETVGQNIPFL